MLPTIIPYQPLSSMTSDIQPLVHTIPQPPAPDSARLLNVRCAMKVLVGCQMGCGLLILIMGSACIAAAEKNYSIICHDAAHLYCSVIALVASSLGLVFTCCSTSNERCTLVAYFVMSIIGAVFAIGPLVAGTVYTSVASKGEGWRNAAMWKFLSAEIGLNSVAAAAGAVMGILFIVSSALTCYLWSEVGCCRIKKPHPETTTLVIAQPSAPVAPMFAPMAAEGQTHWQFA